MGPWAADWSKLSNCIGGALPCATARISKFPPAYLLNSYYLSVMEARGFDRAWALGLINTIFLALPIAFIILVKGVSSSLSRSLIYVVAIVLTALPPFYVYSGALEIQSGVLIGMFISCLALMTEGIEQPRRSILSVLLFTTALLLPLCKDTNALIVGLGLAVAGIHAWRGKKNYSTAWSLLAALTAGVAISMTYNFIKYGSVWPLDYLEEISGASPPPAKILEFFAATYLSPNGGVIVFWAGALCGLLCLLRAFDLAVSKVGASVAVVAVVIYSVILAAWWAPFGWDTWGDRLMIPVMLALVICLAATASGARVEPHEGTPASRVVRVLRNSAIVGVTLLSLHYTFVSYRAKPDAVFRTSLFGGPRCQQMLRDLDANPTMGLAFFRTDSYYACARERFLHVPRP